MYNTASGMVPAFTYPLENYHMKKILVLSALFVVLVGCQQKEAPKAVAPVAAPAEAPAAAPAAAPAEAPAAPAPAKK